MAVWSTSRSFASRQAERVDGDTYPATWCHTWQTQAWKGYFASRETEMPGSNQAPKSPLIAERQIYLAKLKHGRSTSKGNRLIPGGKTQAQGRSSSSRSQRRVPVQHSSHWAGERVKTVSCKHKTKSTGTQGKHVHTPDKAPAQFPYMYDTPFYIKSNRTSPAAATHVRGPHDESKTTRFRVCKKQGTKRIRATFRVEQARGLHCVLRNQVKKAGLDFK